jgi:hypothetical protein
VSRPLTSMRARERGGRLRLERVSKDSSALERVSKDSSAPGKAWVRRKRCRSGNFTKEPCGFKPRPAKEATSRKRVLRGAGATRAAKRRQRVYGPRD